MLARAATRLVELTSRDATHPRRRKTLILHHVLNTNSYSSLSSILFYVLVVWYIHKNLGTSLLEVPVDQLSPMTYDVEGVVAALQSVHPRFLGPDVVSMKQVGMYNCFHIMRSSCPKIGSRGKSRVSVHLDLVSIARFPAAVLHCSA